MRLNRTRAIAATALVAAMALLGQALPASAHAQLALSNPKASATLTKAPTKITLTFDDNLVAVEGANQIVVSDPKGRAVTTGTTIVSGAVLEVGLKKLSINGRYKVLYRVLSADGHPVTAFYYFYLKKR